ncbi:MAG: LamG domain-containing protein [Gammaproteobacteria bacterium]|nr:LamG domain-containing protein [Gammaproteobacteria bacterium]
MNTHISRLARSARRFFRHALLILTVAAVSGCGGGASTVENPVTSGTAAPNYTGPAPATADVQSFKLNVWDNLKANNRCGACHGTGGQTPNFVRLDDVNLAYAAANTIVTLSSPQDSRMVSKVAGGHNCWLASDSACGDIITAYISAWAGGSVSAAGRQIQLTPPPIRDPGASKSFPADATLFSNTVHPVLTTYCAACHRDSSQTPQAPFFANSDAASAYEAAKAKMDLDTPANSRFVLRLNQEFHNCWDDCADNAAEMQAAIQAFADQIPTTQVDPQLVPSKALGLGDGVVAAGGNRHEADTIALYEFKTGAGTIAYDTSGVEPGLNLNLSGQVNWVGGYGLEFTGGKAQGSTTNSKKLADMIRATGEYSIEAWVVPANVTQEGPARIISYSGGTSARNFTLGQTKYNYDFLHRSSTTDGNGQPGLSTADAAERLQATQQHVVVTYDPANGRRIYVNGVHTGDLDGVAGGTLADWDDSFAFVLGNEVSSDRTWMGKLRLVAIHNRALTTGQIVQNFEAGVGEKFYLLFSVSHLVNVPQSYIMFEVSQFDSYSYLFYRPTFISLDANAQPDGIQIQGLRIGINGKEATVGQAYRFMDTTVSSAQYGASGQRLSELGTLIALEKGVSSDEFFLTFERIDTHTHVVTEPAPLQPAPPADSDPVSDIGLRTFDEINASMAAMSQVNANTAAVVATYTTIKQQLPTAEGIEGFLSAHQIAVSQLAIEYCNALVGNTTLRASYFPGFAFGASAATAFDTPTKRDQLIDPLLNNMYGIGLTTQPDPVAVKTELNDLIDRLTACGGGCAADRTETVAKAACAATLGSAAMLLQ